MTYKSYADREKKNLKDKVAGQLLDICIDITKQAQDNANQAPPKHPQVQTGTLRRSITLDVDKKKLEGKVGIMKGSEKADEALVYAPMLEFGTSRMPPYPFLFPAAELITKKAKDYFK